MTGGRPGAPLFCLLAALAAATCGGPTGQPRLDVSPPTVARERFATGARFEIRNTGAGRLHLHAIVADCACRAALGAAALAPGERTTVDARCRVVPGAGAERRLRLHSNDPAGTPRVLSVSVPADGSPAAAFGYVPLGGSATRAVAAPDGAAVVRGAAAAAFSLEPGTRDASGARTYRVRFAPRAPGVARAVIEVDGAVSDVALSGVGFGSVVSYPAEVRTPSSVAEELPPLFVRNLGERSIEIVRVDYPADLTGELQTVVAGREFRLRLRARAGADTSGGPRTIVLHTTAEDVPRLVVPVLEARA